MNLMFDHALRLVQLAEGYLLAGRLDDAERVTGEALELARAQGALGNEAVAESMLADVMAQRGPRLAGGAEARYREALARAAALGMRPTVARCRLGLGSLLRQTGALDRARADLEQAAAALREMAMTYWLGQAEAELALTVTASGSR